MNLDAHLVVRRPAFTLDVALRTESGRVLAVLGPNGAGKTTILRTLAGTIALDDGHLRIGGRTLDEPARRTWVEPEDRRIGLVHQDLLLFPHLSALDNVAFGLRQRGLGRRAARATAAGWLERLDVAEHGANRPVQLSGGQAQRVALARALATEPEVLLLDEPLAALDAGTRQTTRRDLHRWLEAFDGLVVIVTHDPIDALTLAQDVAVVEGGAVVQEGPIRDVAAQPRTRYVADLLGTNLLEGRGRGRTIEMDGRTVHVADEVHGPAFASVAPRSLTVHLAEPEGSARNRWPATIVALDLLGDRVRVHTEGVTPLVAEVTPSALAELELVVGGSVWLAAKATEVAAYER